MIDQQQDMFGLNLETTSIDLINLADIAAKGASLIPHDDDEYDSHLIFNNLSSLGPALPTLIRLVYFNMRVYEFLRSWATSLACDIPLD